MKSEGAKSEFPQITASSMELFFEQASVFTSIRYFVFRSQIRLVISAQRPLSGLHQVCVLQCHKTSEHTVFVQWSMKQVKHHNIKQDDNAKAWCLVNFTGQNLNNHKHFSTHITVVTVPCNRSSQKIMPINRPQSDKKDVHRTAI